MSLLGRWARWALPGGVFLGLVMPETASALRPLLAPAVIGTLTTALLRLDWSSLGRSARAPRLPFTLAAWQLLGAPVVVWCTCWALALPEDLRLVLLLQAAAPPIGSAAVFAMFAGLDGTLAMIGTVLSTLMLPLTLTPMVGLVLSSSGVEIDLAAFFARVSLMVALPFLLAWTLRRAVGVGRLARNDDLLGGLNVVLLVVFAIGVMEGVSANLRANPEPVARMLLLACVATAALHLAGYVIFRRSGDVSAFSAAILSGNRNMGLMMVVTAGSAGAMFPLYVAVAQIPMYFAPLALAPFVRRRGAGQVR